MTTNSAPDLGTEGVTAGPTAVTPPRKRINGDAKGKNAERAVVAYLKPWFPDARRTVRTGYRNAITSAADEGDIDGTPGLCFQVKALGTELVSGKVLNALHADVRVQAAGRLPLILNKRNGRSEVGQWWVWLTVGDLVMIKSGMPPFMVNGGLTLIRVPLFNIISDLRIYSDHVKGTTAA
jgi:hypothetical protein